MCRGEGTPAFANDKAKQGFAGMSIYLGLDVGTTAVKALAVDERARVVALASRQYACQTPAPGHCEQEAEDWWRLACDCVREVAGQVDGPVAALALSTQGDTMVPLDAHGQPLAPAITWMDTRTLPQVAQMQRERDLWFDTTGALPASFAAATSIMWWRQHRPEVFSRAARFALVADFLVERLTGKATVDAPNASRTMLYDLRQRDWSAPLLQRAGVERERLPEVAESGTIAGTVLPAVTAQLGVPAGTPVALGGHDQTCAAIGCGVIEPGSLMLSCGTAWVVLAATEQPVWDQGGSLHSYCHAVPGKYVSLGAFAGGNLLRWFRDTLWDDAAEGPEIIRPAVTDQGGSTTVKARTQPTAGRIVSGLSDGDGRNGTASRHPDSLRSSYPSRAEDPGRGENTHGNGDAAYESITAAAEAARAAGRPPLIFLEHFYGANGPVACREARGAWAGLTLAHTRGDLALALLEGVALQAAWCVENLARQGAPVAQVRMIGGGARSRFWTQLVADALQRPVTLPQVTEAAALGAALIAATAVGRFGSLREAAGEVAIAGEVTPQRPADGAALRRVEKLMAALPPLWEQLSAWERR